MPAISRRWRLAQRILSPVLIALILAACADLSDPTPVAKRTEIPGASPKTTRPSKPAVSPDEQTWLIMLYQDADDEILEEDMFNDLNEAEMVGSTDRVTVVAQMDRYDGGFDGDGNWTSTKRFLIEQDDDLDRLKSEELADLGEVNMADEDTLIDFIVWAAKTYPADKYVLIMSDHGSGWPGGWTDPEPSTIGRHDIPMAESFGDMLFLMEFANAMRHVMAETDIGEFELIGFDACLMSGIEVYSAIAPYARYSVASQEVEPSLGWAYAALLGRLTDSPEIDGSLLSQAIVDSYIEQDQQIVDDRARAKYLERMYEYTDEATAEEVAQEESKQITLVSIDLAAIPDVVTAINDLVTALGKAKQRDISSARRYAQAFESVFDTDQPKPYIDLGHFAKLLKDKIKDPAVDKAADNLLAAIDRAVINEKHGEEKPGATGISIHFPNSKLYATEEAGPTSYHVIADTFANESLWDDFLAFHYKKTPLPSSVAATQGVPATEVAATPTEIEAPGSEAIAVAPVTVSSDTVSRRKPVVFSSKVTGENVAFVYIFIGFVDPNSGDIRMIDMDYLDAEETKEIDGVFYPDWGGASNLEIEFEWDGQLFAISDGSKSELSLFKPSDYGASPEEAVYTVEGQYKTVRGKKWRRAMMLFSDGDLIQVLGYTGKDDNGAMREITPKRGDSFKITEEWLVDTGGSEETGFTPREGATLVFGDDNFTWEDAAAPKGEYIVGFIAEDFDGALYSAHERVTVR